MDTLTCPHEKGCFSDTFLNGTYLIYDPSEMQPVTMNDVVYDNVFLLKKEYMYTNDLRLELVSDNVFCNCSKILALVTTEMKPMNKDCTYRIPYHNTNYDDIMLFFKDVSNGTSVFKIHFEEKSDLPFYMVNNTRIFLMGVALIIIGCLIMVANVLYKRRKQNKDKITDQVDPEEDKFINGPNVTQDEETTSVELR